MARRLQRTSAALVAVAIVVSATWTSTADAAMHHYRTGEATWYVAPRNGPYPARRVCASANLRFGTLVRVRNLATGRTATCVVGDRKPFNAVRIVDLSTAVFQRLAPLGAGVIKVAIAW